MAPARLEEAPDALVAERHLVVRWDDEAQVVGAGGRGQEDEEHEQNEADGDRERPGGTASHRTRSGNSARARRPPGRTTSTTAIQSPPMLNVPAATQRPPPPPPAPGAGAGGG